MKLLVTCLIVYAAVTGHSLSAQSTWSVVPSPNPGTQYNLMNGVAADTVGGIWAVGVDYSDFLNPNTLAAHYSSDSWNVNPTPSPGNANRCGPNEWNQFSGVSASSSSDVWAVGYECLLVQQPIIAHWDGVKWSSESAPTAPGSFLTILTAVSALTPDSAWAVGYYQNRVAANVTLIEHWNGTNWSIVPSPNVPHASGSWLYGVAAISDSDVWAVGTYYSQATRYYNRALIEHWDGNAWSILPTPESGTSVLNAVTATSATDVWAAGVNGARGLVEHYDGSAWTVLPSLNPGDSSVTLTGIAAAGGKAWAVGFATIGTTSVQPYSQRWDGGKWSKVTTPHLGAGSQLFGVAASGSSVYAVGAYATRLHYGSLENPLTLFLELSQ